MRETIIKELHKIEETENVRIIMAIESGSRAWGFESIDSDYDVRFIYVRNEDDYLRLEGVRDVIEWKLDEVLDINGWDLQKALRLLYKSNATVSEWCASPIVYLAREGYEELKLILTQYFSPKKAMFHNLSSASGNYREWLKGDEVKLKKYFYVLRPILASLWITKHKTAPPMLFEELMYAELEKSLLPTVEELLVMKKSMGEMGTAPKIQVLNEYIEKMIPLLREQAEQMDDDRVSWRPLNEFFLEMVRK
ncbi:MAG: nucleotidyltransferase domain-containing protein [Selenomonadales bacterium]|nr:nucleotidyltransferase domain-containing protein [Selenomonadales bacterium]